MILQEKELHSKIIEPLIGKPVELSTKTLKPLGSTSYFLKDFENHDTTEDLPINSKCNFQLYTNGILLKTYYSTSVKAIPIPFKDIIKIELIRGEEFINPMFPSIMWILLKLGVSILIARHFTRELHEYFIEDMKLIITTKQLSMSFIADGYLFEGQNRFFQRLPVNIGSKTKS